MNDGVNARICSQWAPLILCTLCQGSGMWKQYWSNQLSLQTNDAIKMDFSQEMKAQFTAPYQLLRNQNKNTHCSPWSLFPGKNETNGITMKPYPVREQEPGRQRGKTAKTESGRRRGETRVNGLSGKWFGWCVKIWTPVNTCSPSPPGHERVQIILHTRSDRAKTILHVNASRCH